MLIAQQETGVSAFEKRGFKNEASSMIVFYLYHTMEVICLHDEAFFALLEEAVERMKQKQSIQEDRWIDTDAAMKLLGIKSKTTLQDLRNKGKIRYSQQGKRIILYDRNSIMEYHEQNAKEKF